MARTSEFIASSKLVTVSRAYISLQTSCHLINVGQPWDMPVEETVSEAPLSTGWWGTGIECEERCPRGWWWDQLGIHRCRRRFPGKNQKKSAPWAWLSIWKQNLWLWLTGPWIMVAAVIKKNNKVKFKMPWPLECSPWVLQSLLCPHIHPYPATSSVDRPYSTAETCWSVVSGLAFWLLRAEQNVCKYPEVFNLPARRVRMSSGFSLLMWYVNLKVQFFMKMTKINLSTNSKHIFLSISALSNTLIWK